MVAEHKGKKQKVNDEENIEIDGELVLSIEKLQEIQDELEKINEKASDEVLEVEKKYNEIRKPVYDKRNEIVKGIPDFWLTAFLSHPALSELVTDEDHKIFKHLTSIEVEDSKDVKSGYSISFNFEPNPYFEDAKLTKTFTFLDEGTTNVTATTIKWKEGMGFPNGVENDKKGNKRTHMVDSFFTWFSESQQSDDEINDEYHTMRRESGPLTLAELPAKMSKLKVVGENLTEEERDLFLRSSYENINDEVDFELFLRVYLQLHTHANSKMGSPAKNSSAFLKAATTTLLHTISESEKSSYVSHINNYLGEDKFLKQYLPIDPSTNDLFELVKDGVLLCKLINVAVPGTIDERAINMKSMLNPWERNENHTLCLNSATAIGCTVVNIGTQDFIEGRRHLVLGLIAQIIKIQLLADLNLKKTPQLVELVDSTEDAEELMSLPPDKILLRWMNFQLRKAGYKKIVTNFSYDIKDAEAYAHLLNILAPEHKNPKTLTVKDHLQRAKLVLEHADKMGCKRYLTAKDIVEGSPNLNLAFVAHIFQHRNGLSTQTKHISFLEFSPDEAQVSREERAFRFWLNSLGNSICIDNVFEDLRDGWLLLETLDKISPGIVNWKAANKPPIKMPFKKVENCNQVVKLGKQLKFSLVNIAGNDIVQGNKKLILAYLWQLMRSNMIQLLRNLRFLSHGREINDADILEWANSLVKNSGGQLCMKSFKDKSLSDGIFFLELLSAVQPRVVNWGLVTKGKSDEEKKMNASYIISVARKLGCSIFLLPDDITEVNQKMILTLTASIMYWFLNQRVEDKTSSSSDSDNGSQSETSISTLDDATSELSLE